ncbi:hypothetical protein [Nioella aestuarii]|uniref:hypothetical protein n=1 Tax=Nioella aestuarii TaxID=1662864 RepID=UPI003D7FF147
MNISPRIIAIATIGVGAITFGTLMSEARSANIRPLNVETMRAMIQSDASAPPVETVLVSASTGSTGQAPVIEASEIELALPSDAPAAPALPQPQRLAQAAEATTTMTDQPLSPFGLPCGLSISTTASEGAMVALDIMDPCQPHSRVVIEHSGLNLTGRTDVMGLLTMDVPVFENPAFFTVRMPDGASDSSLAIVPDLDSYYRVGLQWNENRSLELHAMEFGATYGDPGHIWLDNAGSIDRAVSGEGGFVMQVGDTEVENPMLAQIYSFPRDTLDGAGNVRMSIEAPVTEANCGQDTLARTLELEEDGRVSVIELTFTLPDCDAVGDYLVLQNLLHDLRVASN